MRKLSSIMSLILVACLLVGGVSASWIYATGAPEPESEEVTVNGNYPETYTIQFINEKEVFYSISNNEFNTTVSLATTETEIQNARKALDAQLTRIKSEENYDGRYNDVTFSHWINAGSFKVTEVTEDQDYIVKIYPSFVGLYTASFVDMNGNILSYFNFKSGDTTSLSDKQTEAENKLQTIFDAESDGELYSLALKEWKIKYQDENGKAVTGSLNEDVFSLGFDITIFPVPAVTGVSMEYVDENNDGIIEEFIANGYGDGEVANTVVIPDDIAGVPVTQISSNAFSSYSGLHVVVLPKYVELVGDNAISDATVGGWFGTSKGETITIYYSGSKSEWIEREQNFDDKWDYGISSNSKIYFLDKNGKVDPTQGYLQASPTTSSGFNQSQTGVEWNENTIDQNYINTMYNKTCDCKTDLEHPTNADGDNRIPDYIYWENEEGTGPITIE